MLFSLPYLQKKKLALKPWQKNILPFNLVVGRMKMHHWRDGAKVMDAATAAAFSGKN